MIIISLTCQTRRIAVWKKISYIFKGPCREGTFLCISSWSHSIYSADKLYGSRRHDPWFVSWQLSSAMKDDANSLKSETMRVNMADDKWLLISILYGLRAAGSLPSSSSWSTQNSFPSSLFTPAAEWLSRSMVSAQCTFLLAPRWEIWLKVQQHTCQICHCSHWEKKELRIELGKD